MTGTAPLRWFFDAGCKAAGALPPEPLSMPFAEQNLSSAIRRGDFVEMWRAVEAGQEIQPSDCPPVRLLGRYGFLARTPGDVTVKKSEQNRTERVFESGHSAYGWGEYWGQPFPASDSGLVASWITGASFFKILTGIKVCFPRDMLLYQGPLPNASLLDQPMPDVMAGLEYFNKRRSIQIDGTDLCVATLSFIAPLPPEGKTLELRRGDPLGWFYCVPRASAFRIAQIDDPR